MVAGAAHQIVQAGTLAAEDNHCVGREVVLIVIPGTALIEAHAPKVALLEGLERAHQVDDPGQAEILRSTSGGLQGNRAQGCRPALGEKDPIDSRGLGSSQQRAQVLGILHTVESQDQTRFGTGKQILYAKKIAFPRHGHDPLVYRNAGQASEGLAWLRLHRNPGGTAQGDDLVEAARVSMIEPLPGNADVIEAPGS